MFIHDFQKPLKKKLITKGFKVIGEFDCRGWDTYPIWVKPFSGINKGKPGEKEVMEAKCFAKNFKEKVFKSLLIFLTGRTIPSLILLYIR